VKLFVFFLIALAVHGPLSPVLPTAFEATLLYYARLYPAWLLALAGTLGASVAEAVNYRLVDWAAELPKLATLKTRKTVRWSVAAFLQAPFWTTVLVIFSPIPDSAVRVLAPLGRYPLAKFLGAIALGRFPRLYLIASVGLLVRVPVWLLLASGVALVALALGRTRAGAAVAWLQSRYRGLRQRLTGTRAPVTSAAHGEHLPCPCHPGGVSHVVARPCARRRLVARVPARALTGRVGPGHDCRDR